MRVWDPQIWKTEENAYHHSAFVTLQEQVIFILLQNEKKIEQLAGITTHKHTLTHNLQVTKWNKYKQTGK